MTIIFKKAFRDTRRTMIWLSVGLGLYALMVMTIYPTLVEQSEEFDRLIESYPEEMLVMFYDGDIAELSISNPGTYVGIEFGIWALLIIGSMVIAQVFNGFTNPERDGSLDLILCLPVSRRQILLGRLANTALFLLGVLAASLAVFLLCTLIWSEFDPDPVNLSLAMLGAFVPLSLVASFAYMLVALIPSSKRFAGALAYLFLIGSYLVHSFAALVDQLSWLRSLMFFDYYNVGTIICDGVVWSDWVILAAATLAYLSVAWWAIGRKDMGI
jgi:ABC-2 type transport system permease protein